MCGRAKVVKGGLVAEAGEDEGCAAEARAGGATSTSSAGLARRVDFRD